ncbi:glycoside hydrolase family 32 protein [Paenibacillus sp.]|uniref:glycoside hydrolase family 32 protein n=1 Tax=Paenibacillus sp. TaxID=58172 RepID=UPI002D5C9B07|nr:glycoside hydrolase family 32 protein [Paenibacillus sp.]HZG85812.1 glycoside hydrolase family 32 protein [Paenibacillus sp.]
MREGSNAAHEAGIRRACEALEASESRVTDRRYRLHYHLMPKGGWMNDPNGLVYFRGEYHAFYQHDPYRPTQGPMHWGHAKSADLVHWEHLPVALAPSEPYDLDESGSAGGCWSGSAVEDDGKLVLMYTGHVDGGTPPEAQCLAVSEDGVRFAKDAANPVIPAPPETGVFGFRDPKVWKRGDTWYAVVGSGLNGKGRALLYDSRNLREWRYIGVAAESDGTEGNMWECPDLFPLGDGGEHVLIVSPMNMGATKTMYMSGTFDYETGTFRRAYAERLDYGFDFYAPQTFRDGRGRRLLLAWMNIWGAAMPEQADGWMGAMTLPRELTLGRDGKLRMRPTEELRALRIALASSASSLAVEEGVSAIPGLRGDALELVAEWEAGSADAFGLRLRCSPDGSEYTEIRYDVRERRLVVDRDRSGAGDGGRSEAYVEPAEDGGLRLHVFLDRSSVEVFAGDGAVTMTNRMYPDPSSLGAAWFAEGGSARLRTFEAWSLKSIW